MLFSFVYWKSGVHPFFFFGISVFARSDQRRDANESFCLLKPAAPLWSRVQCVLCGAGFFSCGKCDDWGGRLACCGKAPGETLDGCKSF